MKLIQKLLILSSFLVLVYTLNLKTSSNLEVSTSEDYSKQWATLFTSVVRPPQLCQQPNRIHHTDSFGSKGGNDSDSHTPKSKANVWAKQQGFGASAYFFDHMDDIFQADVVGQFTQMLAAAKAIQPTDVKYQDPYGLEKLIFFYSQGAHGAVPSGGAPSSNNPLAGGVNPSGHAHTSRFTQSPNGAPLPSSPLGAQAASTPASTDLVSQIQRYNKNFNKAVWENSISAPQLKEIVKQWGWKQGSGSDPIKKLIDTYDFDGDGRLNPSEFILMSIVNNVKIFKQSECKQFCYTDIFTNKVDPLFAFLDCDSDGFVNAENMWTGLVNLKRKDATKFSMYTCQMPTMFNKGYRTTACNDFVLKNYHKADGFLNHDEFRVAILLGYWDRHSDMNKVIPDESKSLKNVRWGQGGVKDTVCEAILALVPKQDNKQNNPPKF